MHYHKINLSNTLKVINTDDLIIKEIPISGIRLYCKYDGQTELMKPGTGTIEFKIRSGVKTTLFELDEAGYIIDNNPDFIFSDQLAQEELIIAKTKAQYVI